MKKYAHHHANGFTLAEVIVCIALLSITTVGVLKAAASTQQSAIASLITFKQLQKQKQLSVIHRLRQRYTIISADETFSDLSCLLESADSCN